MISVILQNANNNEFCALTFAFTNLFVRPRTSVLSLEYKNLTFKFRFDDYFQFVNNHKEEFYNTFHKNVFFEVDFMLFFEVEQELLEIFFNDKDDKETSIDEIRYKECGTQTSSNNVENNLLAKPSWNMWDNYRKIIKMANIKKCETRSSQNVISYGQRNSMIQTFTKKSQKF